VESFLDALGVNPNIASSRGEAGLCGRPFLLSFDMVLPLRTSLVSHVLLTPLFFSFVVLFLPSDSLSLSLSHPPSLFFFHRPFPPTHPTCSSSPLMPSKFHRSSLLHQCVFRPQLRSSITYYSAKHFCYGTTSGLPPGVSFQAKYAQTSKLLNNSTGHLDVFLYNLNFSPDQSSLMLLSIPLINHP